MTEKNVENTNVAAGAVPNAAQDMKDELAAAEAEVRAATERLEALRAQADAAVVAEAPQGEPADAEEAEPETVVEAAAESEAAAEPVVEVVGEVAVEPVGEPTAPFSAQEELTARAAEAESQQPQQAWQYAQPQPEASYQPYQQPYQQAPGQSQPYQQQAYGQGQAYQQYPQGQPYQQYYPGYMQGKDHIAAGLLAIFLGGLGIHKFYLGYNTQGFIMLAIFIGGIFLTLGLATAVISVIAFIEGILYLVKSQPEFDQVYVRGRRTWF